MTVTLTTLDPSATADEALRHIAREAPERVALAVDDRQVSYAELDREVDRLAARLVQDVGHRPAFVALRIIDTVPMVTASLAVTRAGMTMVPIDPTAPPERVTAVLREVEPALLLSDVESDGAETWSVPVADPRGYRADPPAGGVSEPPADIAAVVFTSGSTGRPKGILHSRASRESSARLVRDLWAEYPQVPVPCRFGAITVGTVGLSDGMAHMTLVMGGTFVGYDIRRLGLASWADWMRRERVAATILIPTIWRFLASTLDETDRFPDLNHVVMIGEASTWDDVAALRRHLPDDAHIVNVLAQTEVGISRYDVTPGATLGSGRLPAGSPLPGREIRILDSDGNPLPAGERGEIVVETLQCAAGYWRLPEATARTFEPLPDGRTRVHTGDAGRLLADGSLEHLGRLDHMVKIAGNRVELGDVETGLRALDGVADAAAVAVPGPDGGLRLKAAVVIDPATADVPTALELRDQLSASLPKPMLPDRIHVLDELPTLPGGKVDRVSLAGVLDEADVAADTAAGAAGTTTDGTDLPGPVAEVVRCFAEILDRDDIDGDSDFFAHGGDSLRAAKLMAKLEERHHRNLATSLLLEAPTPAQLAKLLSEGSGSDPLVVLRRGAAGRAPLVLVHDATADVFYARHLLEALDADQPVLGLRAETLSGLRPDGEADLTHVAGRYVTALRSSGYAGPWLIYGFSLGGTIAFELACRLQQAGDDVRLLAVGDSPGPLAPELLGRSHLRLRVSNRISQLRELGPRQAARYSGWLAGRQARHLSTLITQAIERRRGKRAPSPVARLRDTLAAGGPVPSDLVWQLTMDTYAPMLLRYQPRSRFDGDLLLFRAEGPDVRPDNGWGEHVTGAVAVEHLPTAHELIHQGQAAEQLAGRLADAIHRIQAAA